MHIKSVISKQQIESALTRKGFCKSKGKSHHEYYVYHDLKGNKRKAVYTYLSHGCKELDAYLLKSTAKHMRISTQELMQFIECSLTQEAYQNLIDKK